MESFELGREIENKVFFCLVTSMEKKKKSVPQEIKPKTFRFHTLMLYHLPTETLWCARLITKFIYNKGPS